jgi:hypothetical protein
VYLCLQPRAGDSVHSRAESHKIFALGARRTFSVEALKNCNDSIVHCALWRQAAAVCSSAGGVKQTTDNFSPLMMHSYAYDKTADCCAVLC